MDSNELNKAISLIDLHREELTEDQVGELQDILKSLDRWKKKNNQRQKENGFPIRGTKN